MRVSVTAQDLRAIRCDLLAIPLFVGDPSERRLPPRLAALDRELGSPVAAVLASGDFRGRPADSVLVYPPAGSSVKRILLLGMGVEAAVDAEALRRCAGSAVRRAVQLRAPSVALVVPGGRRVQPPAAAQALAEGAVLGGFRFDAYREEKADEGPADVTAIQLVFDRLASPGRARTAAARGTVLAESQNLARRLSNEPANALPPAVLAQEAQKMAKQVGLDCLVMEVPELKKRGMGGILAVGQGSSNPPRLVVLEHNARRSARAAKSRRKKASARTGRPLPTICLVGKGITFDSGGISIKPSAGMQDMKHDMSGAAAVVGALRAAALLRIPLHVVGLIAAAENLPSGTAYRPGDIVRTLSGKTIEILNTDAEGRVVLADALTYAVDEYEPEAVVDLATLTGACMIALGPWATGVFGNNDRLVERIRRAGESAGERAWPMPLLDEHREAMKSKVADLRNAAGREAGASTAAGFLAAFVGDVPWTHLDIAGTGWTDRARPYQPIGATGVGVRLLLELLRTWKEGPRV
ncbi:MAG: leucyl aminopeptidase [Proteobacteria bacterium]|nr:leucyl aminopeptidase [Pseudomonadota bacterium]